MAKHGVNLKQAARCVNCYEVRMRSCPSGRFCTSLLYQLGTTKTVNQRLREVSSEWCPRTAPNAFTRPAYSGRILAA